MAELLRLIASDGVELEAERAVAETVAGASHFFVGRTDRLIDLAATWTRGEISGSRT